MELGLSAVDEALVMVEEHEVHGIEADFYRLRGDLLLLRGELPVVAEACFGRAIACARSWNAKSWEMRAVLSMARLWRGQGKPDDARLLLAECYGWFTEGFDTPDLREAKALLQVLAPAPQLSASAPIL